MIRDKNKDEQYFINYLDENKKDVNNALESLTCGRKPPKTILLLKFYIHNKKLDSLFAEYSLGVDIILLKEKFIILIVEWINSFIYDSLDTETTYGSYMDNVFMFGLCILFDIEESIINEIKKRLKKDKTNDWLYNFLLNPNCPPESIEGKLQLKSTYVDLQEVILTKDNQKELFENYVTKLWYRKQKGCYWWGSHSRDNYNYYGYWCFECAAVAKILGIDDSALKDFKYYPYDLVHYDFNQD